MFLPSGFPVQSKVLEMAIVSSENIVSADESLSWPKTPTTTKHNQNNSGHPINDKSKGDFRGTLGLDRIITQNELYFGQKNPLIFHTPKNQFQII